MEIVSRLENLLHSDELKQCNKSNISQYFSTIKGLMDELSPFGIDKNRNIRASYDRTIILDDVVVRSRILMKSNHEISYFCIKLVVGNIMYVSSSDEQIEYAYPTTRSRHPSMNYVTMHEPIATMVNRISYYEISDDKKRQLIDELKIDPFITSFIDKATVCIGKPTKVTTSKTKSARVLHSQNVN